jgi:molecular chaperone DnaK
MSRPLVGIDLGTTNSVVATVADDGQVVILRNPVGEELTPSAVYFEPDGSVVVGEEAMASAAIDPGNGVQLIKRHMGTEFPLTIRGQDHTPESVSALILKQLARVASGGRDLRVSAVITVPAYFGTAEREATYQAGLIAGLDVLELLDEPVAAAAHYGLTAGQDRTVLVYDLGGGTFDTTVLRISDGAVTVIATDGHHALGGADIDQRLLDLVLDRLDELMPSAQLDEFLEDKRLLSDLVLDVEAAKRDLSSRVSRPLVIRTRSGKTSVTVTRADLDAVCGDLFDTTTEIIERVLGVAGQAGTEHVDDVIMVGGSSRIPALAEKLKMLLGVSPRLVDPDLAIAKGAALRARHLSGAPRPATLARPGRSRPPGTVSTVTPRAVGILVQDSYDPTGERGFVEHFVTANTPLPASQTLDRFGTILPSQESVRIQVYEQAGASLSAEAGHNRLVLDGELTQLPPLPAGSMIEITMRIAADGRLSVIAREPVSGRELTLEALVDGVVDSAETQRLTRLVGLTSVRG